MKSVQSICCSAEHSTHAIYCGYTIAACMSVGFKWHSWSCSDNFLKITFHDLEKGIDFSHLLCKYRNLYLHACIVLCCVACLSFWVPEYLICMCIYLFIKLRCFSLWLINPRRACAARVTVVGSVCVCVRVSVQHLTFRASFPPENHITCSTGIEGQKICGVSLKLLCCRDPAFPALYGCPLLCCKMRMH